MSKRRKYPRWYRALVGLFIVLIVGNKIGEFVYDLRSHRSFEARWDGGMLVLYAGAGIVAWRFYRADLSAWWASRAQADEDADKP